MRLYDFHCDDCAAQFEDLVRDLSEARCPKCGSSHVAKELSAFAVGSGSTPAKAGGACCGGGGECCGGGGGECCGGGGCGMN